MQNNGMLQARYRYLQARRDREYELLKEQERLAKPPVLEILKEVMIDSASRMNAAICPSCSKEFKDKRGLSSHIRQATCGGT